VNESPEEMYLDTRLKLGALHCWILITHSVKSEDICVHAEKYMLDIISSVIDNSVQALCVCGLALAIIEEAAIKSGYKTAISERHIKSMHVLASDSTSMDDCISLFNMYVHQCPTNALLSHITNYLINHIPYNKLVIVHGGIITVDTFHIQAVLHVIKDIYQSGFNCVLRSFPGIADLVGWDHIQFISTDSFSDDLPPHTDEKYYIQQKHQLQLQHKQSQEHKEFERTMAAHPHIGILPSYGSTEDMTEIPHHSHRKGRDNCYQLANSSGTKHGGSHIKHMIYGTYFSPKT